mgnify:CR=1 FL=1
MSPFRPSPRVWALLLVPAVLAVAWFVVTRQTPDASADLLAAPGSSSSMTEQDALVTAVAGDTRSAAERTPDDPGAVIPADTTSDTPGGPPNLAEPVVADESALDTADFSEWTTYDDAVKQSRAQGKPVMVAFHADWSEGSEQLKARVFDDVAAGVTLRAAVIPVLLVDRTQVDGANSAQWDALQQRFHVTHVPALVVFSPATGRVRRQQGWHGAAPTLTWIVEAATAVK